MKHIEEMKEQGSSIRAISRLTGLDRKTVNKYLIHPEVPVYRPRLTMPGKLDPFKPYLDESLQAGVRKAVCFCGNCASAALPVVIAILTDWLRPQRH